MGIFKVQMRFSVSLVSIQITVQLKWDKVKSTKINNIYGRYILWITGECRAIEFFIVFMSCFFIDVWLLIVPLSVVSSVWI